VVGAAVFWVAYSSAELHALEAGLRAQAQVIGGGLQERGSDVTYEGRPTLPDATLQGIAVGAMLLDTRRRVLMRSSNAPPRPALVAMLTSPGVAGTTTTAILTARLGGGDDRVLLTPLQLGDGRPAELVLVRPLATYAERLGHVGLYLAVTVIGLTVLAAVSAYLLAGQVLRPVRVITATARELSERDLHRRITLALPPDELGELAATFNDMLARLEAAFGSLNRFTADAAHELRTPLALMRSEIQVTLRGGPDLAEHRATLEAVLADVDRLTRTADQLLLLARADAGVLTPRCAWVGIDDVLDEVAARWHPTLVQRDTRLCVQLPGAGAIFADRDMIRRLLDNLIDNAARHAAGGTITLRGAAVGDGVELTVRDTGSGVDPAVRGRIFERFTRCDPARGRETGGAGLGLSICDAIARLHGGAIRLDDAFEQGACFRVWLPMEASFPDGEGPSD
jgi:signal transduction histidine kinase